MAKGVTRETLVGILTAKGFERCTTSGDIHLHLIKKFAPGVGIEVTILQGYSIIQSAAFFDFNELFPTSRLGFGLHYVGNAYVGPNSIPKAGENLFDSERLEEVYAEHQRALSAELKTVTALKPCFDY